MMNLDAASVIHGLVCIICRIRHWTIYFLHCRRPLPFGMNVRQVKILALVVSLYRIGTFDFVITIVFEVTAL